MSIAHKPVNELVDVDKPDPPNEDYNLNSMLLTYKTNINSTPKLLLDCMFITPT